MDVLKRSVDLNRRTHDPADPSYIECMSICHPSVYPTPETTFTPPTHCFDNWTPVSTYGRTDTTIDFTQNVTRAECTPSPFVLDCGRCTKPYNGGVFALAGGRRLLLALQMMQPHTFAALRTFFELLPELGLYVEEVQQRTVPMLVPLPVSVAFRTP